MAMPMCPRILTEQTSETGAHEDRTRPSRASVVDVLVLHEITVPLHMRGGGTALSVSTSGLVDCGNQGRDSRLWASSLAVAIEPASSLSIMQAVNYGLNYAKLTFVNLDHRNSTGKTNPGS